MRSLEGIMPSWGLLSRLATLWCLRILHASPFINYVWQFESEFSPNLLVLGFHPVARSWSLPGNFNDMWNAIISLFSITVGLYQGDFREIQGAVAKKVEPGDRIWSLVEALGPTDPKVSSCHSPWGDPMLLTMIYLFLLVSVVLLLNLLIAQLNQIYEYINKDRLKALTFKGGILWVVDIVVATMMNTSIKNCLNIIKNHPISATFINIFIKHPSNFIKNHSRSIKNHSRSIKNHSRSIKFIMSSPAFWS